MGSLPKKLEFDKNNYLQRFTNKSPFKTKLLKSDLMELENQIWNHKHNHDYIVINELNTRDFIKKTIEILEEELNK